MRESSNIIVGKQEVSKPQRERAKTKKVKIPKGHRIYYEDDLVEVYDDKGKVVDSGLLDYSVYKDDERQWNEKDKNYDLPHGYKMVGLTRH